MNELKVQKTIHLQRIANRLLDSFADFSSVTKSYILTINTLIRIEILVGYNVTPIVVGPKTSQKRGLPLVLRIKILKREKD